MSGKTRSPPPRKWLAQDYCPMPLRSLAFVLADAEPDVVSTRPLTYRWWASGGDWWGVNPPAGVIPHELAAAIAPDLGRRTFDTRAEALDALRAAVAKLEEQARA